MTQQETQELRDIATPHPHDVLSGRGNFVNNHAGNAYFRSLVKSYKIAYVAAPKDQKAKFSRQIVDEIRVLDPPGRFLKQDPETQLWEDIGDKKAVDKTRQALREGAPDLLKEITTPNDDETPAKLDEEEAQELIRILDKTDDGVKQTTDVCSSKPYRRQVSLELESDVKAEQEEVWGFPNGPEANQHFPVTTDRTQSLSDMPPCYSTKVSTSKVRAVSIDNAKLFDLDSNQPTFLQQLDDQQQQPLAETAAASVPLRSCLSHLDSIRLENLLKPNSRTSLSLDSTSNKDNSKQDPFAGSLAIQSASSANMSISFGDLIDSTLTNVLHGSDITTQLQKLNDETNRWQKRKGRGSLDMSVDMTSLGESMFQMSFKSEEGGSTDI